MTKFSTLIRIEKNPASDVAAAWCATSIAAIPKENTINAKSKTLAAWRRMRRRRVDIRAVDSGQLIVNREKRVSGAWEQWRRA